MKSDKIFSKIQFLGGANNFKSLPRSDLLEIVFWGRSNVGKSSTINSIFNNKTAKVSQTPGRTQQINLFTIGDKDATIVDLPGYGYAKVSKTIASNLYKLCYDYLHSNRAKVVFLLLDSRRGFMDIDHDVIEALNVLDYKTYFVFTKVDLLKQNELNILNTHLDGLSSKYFMISNKEKDGIIEIRSKIIDIINEYKNSSKKSK